MLRCNSRGTSDYFSLPVAPLHARDGHCVQCAAQPVYNSRTAGVKKFSVTGLQLTTFSLVVWLWLVVNDHKFSIKIVFFSHTNQLAVFFHEPAMKRTSQPNTRLECDRGRPDNKLSVLNSEWLRSSSLQSRRDVRCHTRR